MSKYDFMYKNICIGTLTHLIVDGADWFSFTLTNKEVPDFYLPVEFYGIKNIDKNRKVEMHEIMLWLSYRVVPRNRQALSKVLDKYGLKEYNVWEMIKQNHGATFRDYFWIRREDEKLEYKDFHVRYKLDNNINE